MTKPQSKSTGRSVGRTIVLLAALTLVAAGCSSSAEPSDPTTESPHETTPVGLSSDGPAGFAPAPQPGHGEELEDYLVRCIQSYGFAAERHGDAMFMPDVGDGAQREQLMQAYGLCNDLAAEMGLFIVRDMNNPADAAEQYWELVEVHSCLQEHGFPVENPPSEGSFIDSRGAWNPYYTLSFQDAKRGDELCPSDHWVDASYLDKSD